MPNNVRPMDTLLALFADNNVGGITPQYLRDFVVSIYDHADGVGEESASSSIAGVSNPGGDIEIVGDGLLVGTNSNTITLVNLTEIENVGEGQGVFKQKTENTFQLYTLVAGDNINLEVVDDAIVISSEGGGGGSGTPGGSDRQVQFNDDGEFSGFSNFTVSSDGDVGITGSLQVDAINIDGNTISATNEDGQIILSPQGDGWIQIGPNGDIRGINSIDLQMSREFDSQVASGTSSFTVGKSNTASGYCSVSMGYNNRSMDIFTTSIGYGALADRPGQLALAAGTFLERGDAQTGICTARCITNSSVPNVMFLVGSEDAGEITIRQGTTWFFTINLLAQRGDVTSLSEGEETSAWEIKGVVRCLEQAQIVGTPWVNRVSWEGETAEDWNFTLSVDGRSLFITVYGADGVQIQWVATIITTETSITTNFEFLADENDAVLETEDDNAIELD